jgi:hypothetical protein
MILWLIGLQDEPKTKFVRQRRMGMQASLRISSVPSRQDVPVRDQPKSCPVIHYFLKKETGRIAKLHIVIVWFEANCDEVQRIKLPDYFVTRRFHFVVLVGNSKAQQYLIMKKHRQPRCTSPSLPVYSARASLGKTCVAI